MNFSDKTKTRLFRLGSAAFDSMVFAYIILSRWFGEYHDTEAVQYGDKWYQWSTIQSPAMKAYEQPFFIGCCVIMVILIIIELCTIFSKKSLGGLSFAKVIPYIAAILAAGYSDNFSFWTIVLIVLFGIISFFYTIGTEV